MGYELHITRRDFWAEPGSDISLDEWKAYVASDAEMRMDNFAEAPLEDGGVLRMESDGLAVWTKWANAGAAHGQAWIYWFEGTIDAKNPDLEFRRKIFAIATALKAKVQGDDGELYGADGEMIEEAQEVPAGGAHRSPEHPKRPWWKII